MDNDGADLLQISLVTQVSLRWIKYFCKLAAWKGLFNAILDCMTRNSSEIGKAFTKQCSVEIRLTALYLCRELECVGTQRSAQSSAGVIAFFLATDAGGNEGWWIPSAYDQPARLMMPSESLVRPLSSPKARSSVYV